MPTSLIIGGTKGLGRVVVRQLASRGDKVLVLGRSPVPQEDMSAGEILGYQADLADFDSVRQVLEQILEQHGKLNYVVFLQRYRGKDDDWLGEFQITLTATKNIVDYLVPHFSREGDNGLMMVSSVFARFVGAGQAASYHVAKAGLDHLMRYYALNLGPKRIRANAITPFTFLKEESKSFYVSNKPLMEMYEQIIPLGRMATTEDSANVISFLCSPQASFITGQNLLVDGGLSLAWPETLARQIKAL